MRYACLIYYHPKTLFGGSPEAKAALAECQGFDVKLKESGHFVMGEALELPESAMTVKVRDGEVSSVDGPFMEPRRCWAHRPDRCTRPQRGRPGCERASDREDRLRRSPAARGLQPTSAATVTADARNALEAAYRNEKRRVLATLIRLLGGFEAAEEALHEAFAAAADRWPREGIPENPYPWLVSTGRFRTIDRWRRQARLAGALPDWVTLADTASEDALFEVIQDDELRLIFICCHPALPPDSRFR